MRAETRRLIADLICRHMEDNGITFTVECPFPVSWRTIWAIRDIRTKKNFTTKTQICLCDFFGLKYEQDGHDVKII